MGKMQRAKGASYERWVANRLKVFYPEAKRGLGQVRDAGETSDVDGTPFWVECKHHKRPNLYAALDQAVEAAAGRKPPLVVARRNGDRDVAVLYFEDLMQIVAHAQWVAEKMKTEETG